MNVLHDLRFALRSLSARAGTAVFATLTLATGMAAAIAISCVIDAVLVRALPYPDAGELVKISEVAADGHSMALAEPNYDDLVASVGSLSSSAVHNDYSGTIRSADNTIRATIDTTGGNFFGTLGVAPQLGRTYAAGEHDKVAVVADELWRGLLSARGDVLGSTIDINGDRYTIIGVMPHGFAFPASAVAWMPSLDPPYTSRTAHNWEAIGRLRASTDLGEARLAANSLASRLKAQLGDGIDAVGFDITPLRDAIAAPARSALLLLAAGIAFLLLIAIINTTNLLLAMNGARTRELAVRAALGASGGRLARQILLESLLVALTATALALGAAALAVRAIVRAAGDALPRADEIHLGGGVVAASFVASIAITLIAAGSVWFNTRRKDPVGELRESSRGLSAGRNHLRTRTALLIGQTALTTVLLVGAGLLARSFIALLQVDAGFDADGAVSVQVSQPWTRDAASAAATARRYEDLIGAFKQLPGVASVGGVSSLPLAASSADGAFWDGTVTDIQHAPPWIGYAEFRVASDDYFKAAGIPVLRGRVFNDGDVADGTHVAVISAAAAHAAWGDRDPIGQRIQMGNMDGDMHAITIIGIVVDVHERKLERAPKGSVYVDIAQRPAAAAEFNIVVRSDLPTQALMDALRGVLRKSATGIPYSLHPLTDVRADALAGRKLSLLLLGAFAAIALVLAVGGVYGLMAFAVGQRRHEFAVRQALGSTRRAIAALVLRNGLAIGGAGIALGLVLALVSAEATRSVLYGVPASDPLTLVGVCVLLLGTLLLASLLPARRACAVAPREALN